MLKGLWKEPLCNHKTERGVFICNKCLPLCARCTGIQLGCTAYMMLVIYLVYISKFVSFSIMVPSWKIGLLLLLPTMADGLWQYIFGMESTNIRRVVTGILAGVGCGVINFLLWEYLIKEWIHYFNG